MFKTFLSFSVQWLRLYDGHSQKSRRLHQEIRRFKHARCSERSNSLVKIRILTHYDPLRYLFLKKKTLEKKFNFPSPHTCYRYIFFNFPRFAYSIIFSSFNFCVLFIYFSGISGTFQHIFNTSSLPKLLNAEIVEFVITCEQSGATCFSFLFCTIKWTSVSESFYSSFSVFRVTPDWSKWLNN